jgi:predicted DsbA family dithiol-disulfide isomerase
VTAEQARREFDAEVVWLPFDLHPEYPPEGIPLADLHRRYGIRSGEEDPLGPRFEAAGLEYNRPETVPNTRLALRLSELARDRGLHEAFHDRLMDAYWAEATNIGDPDRLRRLAAEVGLDAEEVEDVIADPSTYLDVVEASTREAQSMGINAIPAFVLDRRLIVLGAQPLAVFRQAFAELGSAGGERRD